VVKDPKPVATVDLGVAPVSWHDRSGRRFEVGLHLVEMDNRLECVGLSVSRPDHDVVVNGTLLREIPVERLVAKAVAILNDIDVALSFGPGQPLNWAEMDDEWRARRTEAFRSEAEQEARVRKVVADSTAPRRRYPADHLEQVARVYLDSAPDGEPTKAVAARFKVKRSAAAKWVAKCRQQGLLPPTTKGRMSVKIEQGSK
jgi:hypothetical protein